MIKKVKDYIPEITKAINDQEGQYGFSITEREVQKVLSYYFRNFHKVIKRKHVYIDIKNVIIIRPFLAPLYRKSAKKK